MYGLRVIRTVVLLANVFASKQRLEGFADGLISGPGKESQEASLALEQAADGLGDGKGPPVPVFLPVLESPCVAQEHGPIVLDRPIKRMGLHYKRFWE